VFLWIGVVLRNVLIDSSIIPHEYLLRYVESCFFARKSFSFFRHSRGGHQPNTQQLVRMEHPVFATLLKLIASAECSFPTNGSSIKVQNNLSGKIYTLCFLKLCAWNTESWLPLLSPSCRMLREFAVEESFSVLMALSG